LPPLISSFDHQFLASLQQARCRYPLGFLSEYANDSLLSQAQDLGCQTYNCQAQALNAEFIKKSRALGMPVLAFTVNDSHLAGSLFKMGVAAIFTDRPEQFIANTPIDATLDIG